MTTGTSLVVKWLDSKLPMQGAQVQSLVGELRFHMSCGQKKEELEPNFPPLESGLTSVTHLINRMFEVMFCGFEH